MKIGIFPFFVSDLYNFESCDICGFSGFQVLFTLYLIYPLDVKNLQHEIRSEIDALHFRRAIELLNTIPEDEKNAEDWMHTGVCHAAAYDWAHAKEDYLKALDCHPAVQLANKIRLRMVSLLTQTGAFDEAAMWYQEVLDHSSDEDFNANRLFTGAVLDYERGNLKGALDLVLQLAKHDDKSLGRIRCEAWTLCGDLYSALGDFAQALYAYSQSLRLVQFYPQNWRDLRRALILNNLADVYEQFELYSQADKIYQRAWNIIETLDDPLIYDLDGYKLEILISTANFCALNDDTDQAKARLELAEKYASRIEMPQALYWKSRIDYIGGLAELYTENPKYNPFEKLFSAWKLQTEYLKHCAAASKEYLARTAYYAAYCYDETLAEGVTQEELYLQALDEFKHCSFKDPKFFLFCIASVQNELGNMETHRDPAKAADLYAQACRGFERYLKRWPDDLLAYFSLTTVLLNFLSVADSILLETYGEKILDRIIEVLAVLDQDEQTHEQAREAAEKLLELESLYPLFFEKLEQIHQLYCEQPLQ